MADVDGLRAMLMTPAYIHMSRSAWRQQDAVDAVPEQAAVRFTKNQGG